LIGSLLFADGRELAGVKHLHPAAGAGQGFDEGADGLRTLGC